MARHRRAGLVLVAAIALGACGDDDDTSTPAATDGAPSASVSVAGGRSTDADPTTTDASTAVPTTAAAPAAAPTTTGAPAGGSPGADPAVTFSEVATLQTPVDLAWRDGDEGLYVVEQAGRVVRLTDESMATVLDITDLTEASGERGLLGLTFDPDGELAYVNYTDNTGWTIIAEYPVDTDGTFRGGDEARIVMEIEQPYPNHNGGDLTYGPDGMLYIGMGDGGDGGDPQRRATDMSTLLGKMLRIDPTPSNEEPYTVPADNPFVAQAGTAPEIWASGLRNPWRFSFDRETGDLWIADVGQGQFEEIDVAAATGGVDAGEGLSFGWSAFEGDARFNEDVPEAGHTPPFSTYDHDDGRCSISGGVRVRGGPVPELVGWYVYADYCSGQVWALEVTGDGSSLESGRVVELGQLPSVTAVVDGPGGEVYVVSGAGEVARLDPA